MEEKAAKGRARAQQGLLGRMKTTAPRGCDCRNKRVAETEEWQRRQDGERFGCQVGGPSAGVLKSDRAGKERH